MAEFIEKQAAIDALGEEPVKWIDAEFDLGTQDQWRLDVKAIKAVPPADVRPVVRSQWKKNDNGTYSCERCHSWIPKQQWHYANYCLYCGAYMYEGEDAEYLSRVSKIEPMSQKAHRKRNSKYKKAN